MPLFDFYIMVDWSGAKYARCGLVNVPATIASMGTGHVSWMTILLAAAAREKAMRSRKSLAIIDAIFC